MKLRRSALAFACALSAVLVLANWREPLLVILALPAELDVLKTMATLFRRTGRRNRGMVPCLPAGGFPMVDKGGRKFD